MTKTSKECPKCNFQMEYCIRAEYNPYKQIESFFCGKCGNEEIVAVHGVTKPKEDVNGET